MQQGRFGFYDKAISPHLRPRERRGWRRRSLGRRQGDRKQVDRDIKVPMSSLITTPEKTASYVPAYFH